MKQRIIVILLMSIAAANINANAQNWKLGLKYFGLSIHTSKTYNSELMPLKLDGNAVFAANVGAMASVEWFVWKDVISVKFVQAAYGDCLLQPAGFTHIGVRGGFSTGKHSLYGGIGPTLIYRKNWYNVEGYNDEWAFFKGGKHNIFQWRFLWYGGEFEYNYNLHKQIDLSVTFIPGFLDLAALAVGVRYNIIDKPKKEKK